MAALLGVGLANALKRVTTGRISRNPLPLIVPALLAGAALSYFIGQAILGKGQDISDLISMSIAGLIMLLPVFYTFWRS